MATIDSKSLEQGYNKLLLQLGSQIVPYFPGFLLFLNFFSLKTFVSRFQIVASIAKIAATALVIGTGLYYLFFKGEHENCEFDTYRYITLIKNLTNFY